MVQFHTEADRQLFLLEVGKRIDEADTPSDHKLFVKRRHLMGSLFKDFNRANAAKRNWNTNRFNLMTGIRRYHHSTEGKKFHRQLGRFITTHMFVNKEGSLYANTSEENFSDLLEDLKTELSFYVSFADQVIIEQLIELISNS
jgi:virulence-associated protein VapD